MEDRSGYKVKLYDDALDILKFLKSKGICLAVASRQVKLNYNNLKGFVGKGHISIFWSKVNFFKSTPNLSCSFSPVQ